MSQENVEVVKEVFSAWKDRDREKALKRIDPEIEVDFTQVSQVPAATADGADGLEHVVGDWLQVWGTLDFFPQNFIDAGDDVIVWLRVTMRGRESGVPVEYRLAVVYTVSGGRVTRFRGYDTLETAAAQVGI